MKKEELNELKQEYEALINKLQDLSEDELKEIAGGIESVNDLYENIVISGGSTFYKQ
ncbi:MAG: hypothetical protein Q4E33_05135 [Erysipelotrichaceae bacterium]|nr:hypothetical protein [Erysipelotrichaceae bacterium]